MIREIEAAFSLAVGAAGAVVGAGAGAGAAKGTQFDSTVFGSDSVDWNGLNEENVFWTAPLSSLLPLSASLALKKSDVREDTGTAGGN